MMNAQPQGTAAIGAHLLESIRNLARRASIETSAKSLAEVDAYPELVAPDTDVYFAWIPGTPHHHVVTLAKRLRLAGMNPVPHVAARSLTDRAMAAGYLAGLRDEAGVRRALVIAGDSDVPVGGYDSSAALLESGLLQAHGIRSVGIAGYPEGHPRIPEAALMAALDRKMDYAAGHGLDLFMVTQFCFDGQVVLDWLGRLRSRGLVMPVRVGVAGPASIRTLLKYAMRCGVGNSIRALGSQAVSLTRLIGRHGPEAVVQRIASMAVELNVAGLHLFPFGGFTQSAQWMDNVAAGRIRLGEPEAGFSIDTHHQTD